MTTPENKSADIGSDAEFCFSSDFGVPESSVLSEGFNEYGVRENTDDETGELDSVDVMYRAMEPGPPDERKGVRITEEFLRNVASKEYSQPPFMLDHEEGTLNKLGHVRRVFYEKGALYVVNRIPNTGSSVKSDVISDYTHEPPAIQDGSVGFKRDYEIVVNEADEPEMKDGKLREFSTTPFPGGYDEGGVQATAAFSDAVEAEFNQCDEEPNEQGGSEAGSPVATFTIRTSNMEFKTVEPTDDLDEMDADELKEFAKEVSEVNDENEMKFEELQEQAEAEPEVETVVPDEYQEFKEDLVEEVADASPFEADELGDFSIGRLDELRNEFGDDEQDDAEFDDMGEQGETHPDSGESEFSSDEVKLVANVAGIEPNA